MTRLALIPPQRMARCLVITSLISLVSVLATNAWAHGDEDHAPAATAPASPAPTSTPQHGRPPATMQAPQRQADGSVWMPKPVQYRLGIRTTLAHTADWPVTVELHGKVIADPSAGGRVQASQAGRIQAGPSGLPTLGQTVRQGQVLAYLAPASSSLDRGNQQAALADLQAQYTLAARKATRYEQLEGAVPQKDIDAARVERDSLQKRMAAIASSVSAPEPLRAPVSGTVATMQATLGQVVDAKDVLFEIVDPKRLMIEALAYDPTQTVGLQRASAALYHSPSSPSSAQGAALALQFVGGGRQLREQAMPVLFRIQQADAPVAIGQAVTVTAQTSQTLAGIAVPRTALTRAANGDTLVWVHDAAEHFSPKVVRQQALDARQVVITSGLHDGDRVVSEGANLLAQVR